MEDAIRTIGSVVALLFLLAAAYFAFTHYLSEPSPNAGR